MEGQNSSNEKKKGRYRQPKQGFRHLLRKGDGDGKQRETRCKGKSCHPNLSCEFVSYCHLFFVPTSSLWRRVHPIATNNLLAFVYLDGVYKQLLAFRARAAHELTRSVDDARRC